MKDVGIAASPVPVTSRPVASRPATRGPRRNQCFSTRWYFPCRFCIPCCNRELIRRSGPGRGLFFGPSTRAQAIGVNDRAFKVEKRMAPPMARAIGW